MNWKVLLIIVVAAFVWSAWFCYNSFVWAEPDLTFWQQRVVGAIGAVIVLPPACILVMKFSK